MRQLDPPATADVRWFQKIVDAKHNPTKAHLTSAKTVVIGCYRQYVAVAPAVDTVPGAILGAEQRAALLHAYERETAPMARLRGRLLGPVSVRRCPFCGLSEAGTLDHYLPKETYPEYAVFPKNLVPCCSICNLRKQRLVVDQARQVRLFLHPYYDDIPNTRFLTLEVRLRRSAIVLRYRLFKPAAVPRAVFVHLQNHFDLLKLADRYRVMSLDELRGRFGAISDQYGPEQNARRLSNFLAQEAASYSAEYGLNHWRAVLYATLADHNDFCDGGFVAIVGRDDQH